MLKMCAAVTIAAALTFGSLVANAPTSSAAPVPAVAAISATTSRTPTLLPLTKKIRKGVYRPNGWNCPKVARIKGNRSSHIYHMPWQRFYKRTKPELCFTTQAVAHANGYRKSKV